MADNKKDKGKLSSEKVLKVLYTEQKLDEYDYDYIDQANNKSVISFLKIKLLCQHCSQSFFSRLAFYKELKAKCVPVQNLVNATSFA